jgi:hypothetical protein
MQQAVQALFQKKQPYATNTTHHTHINKQSEKLTSRVHQNCIYLWTETHCDDTNIRITRKRTERVRSFVRSFVLQPMFVACLLACLPLPPHPTQETPPAPTPPTLSHSPDKHSLLLLLLLSADDDD